MLRLLGGTDGSSAPAIDDGWLKPNRSAVARNRLAPTLTPSGPNTELHETANAFTSVPPQFSPPALVSVKPPTVAWVAYGKFVLGVTRWAPSAAVVVTIFIVEPGGCNAEKAIPASASRPPVWGSIAAIPAY